MQRRNKMKKMKLLLLLLALSAALSACTFPRIGTAEKKQDKVENENGELNIYHPEGLRVEKREQTYRLRTPDNLTQSVEELLTELVTACDNQFTSYTYMLGEDNNLALTIVVQADASAESRVLLAAAITETLFQLPEIETISLTRTSELGEKLSEEIFTRSSVYYYDSDGDAYDRYNPRTVRVYEAGADGATLVEKSVRIYPTPGESMEKLVIDHLAASGTIPRSTKVLSVSVSRDCCSIKLSDSFLDDVSGHTPETVIYAVVNSVCSLSEDINSVRILIDGSEPETFHNTVSISSPLVFNSAIVQEP